MFYALGEAAFLSEISRFSPTVRSANTLLSSETYPMPIRACVRLSKLYFGMLQISLGSLVWALLFRWYSFTGGDDGILVFADNHNAEAA